jgi:serine/threonine protein kinase
MLSETISLSERQKRLQEIILSCEKALDEGQPLDRQQLLEIHADLANELRSYFADLDWFQQSARLRGADRDPMVVESFGEYELIEEIDRGGMGVVLRSRDRDLGRDLAIKVMRSEHKDNPALVQRFIKEAEICGRLQHPGIVPVHERGQLPDGRYYFTMKLVEGKTLADLLKRRPTVMELPHFLAVFDQICQAMGYAHSQHVIHRDLKPSNIMVGIHGDVQVMDWGLAKILREDDTGLGRGGAATGDNLSHAGDIIGTPSYMAPEQAQGKVDELDARCDVFSLGAILCEILTGKPPYGVEDVLAKAQRGDLADALVTLDACGADERLIYLAMHCLSSNPSYRPRNAGEVARELREYVDSLNASAKAAEEERRATEDQARRATAQAAAAERKLKVAYNWLKASAAAVVITSGLLGWTGLRSRVATTSNSALPLKVAPSEKDALPAPVSPPNASAKSQDEDRREKQTPVKIVASPIVSSSPYPDGFGRRGEFRDAYVGFNPTPWRTYSINPLNYHANRPDFFGVTAPEIFADSYSAVPGIHGNYGFPTPLDSMGYRAPTIAPDISLLLNASRYSNSLGSAKSLMSEGYTPFLMERPSPGFPTPGPMAPPIKVRPTPIRPIIP